MITFHTLFNDLISTQSYVLSPLDVRMGKVCYWHTTDALVYDLFFWASFSVALENTLFFPFFFTPKLSVYVSCTHRITTAFLCLFFSSRKSSPHGIHTFVTSFVLSPPSPLSSLPASYLLFCARLWRGCAKGQS